MSLKAKFHLLLHYVYKDNDKVIIVTRFVAQGIYFARNEARSVMTSLLQFLRKLLQWNIIVLP